MSPSTQKLATQRLAAAPLARRIRQHLDAQAKTPRRLSLEAGLSPDTVTMILNGRTPHARTAERLWRVLDSEPGSGASHFRLDHAGA